MKAWLAVIWTALVFVLYLVWVFVPRVFGQG